MIFLIESSWFDLQGTTSWKSTIFSKEITILVDSNSSKSAVFLGGPPKLFVECVVLSDPHKPCFIALLRKIFWKIGVCVILWDQTFLENRPKIRNSFENFLTKSMFNASKWSQMERFWRVLMKSPIKIHTNHFWKILKIFENLTPKPPKIHFLLHF